MHIQIVMLFLFAGNNPEHISLNRDVIDHGIDINESFFSSLEMHFVPDVCWLGIRAQDFLNQQDFLHIIERACFLLLNH